MRISIALATHNGAAFLDDQLASLTAQTLAPFELVACDDCSTDNTVDLLRVFAASSRFPVRIHANSERLGAGNTFLKAAKLCDGEYVAFCDQDDIWHPEKLKRCSRFLLSSSPRLVIHTGIVTNSELRRTLRTHPRIRRLERVQPLTGDPWFNVPGYAEVFSRDLLSLVHGESRPPSRHSDYAMGHDEWVYFLAFSCAVMTFLPDRLVLYRQHSSNSSGLREAGFNASLRKKIVTGDTVYRQNASLLKQYGTYWREQASSQGGRTREWMISAGGFYDDMATLSATRAEIYDASSTFAGRLRSFGRLLGCGGYGGKSYRNFQSRSLLKDALALCFPRVFG